MVAWCTRDNGGRCPVDRLELSERLASCLAMALPAGVSTIRSKEFGGTLGVRRTAARPPQCGVGPTHASPMCPGTSFPRGDVVALRSRHHHHGAAILRGRHHAATNRGAATMARLSPPPRRRHRRAAPPRHAPHQCIDRAATPWHTLHQCIVRAYRPDGRRMRRPCALRRHRPAPCERPQGGVVDRCRDAVARGVVPSVPRGPTRSCCADRYSRGCLTHGMLGRTVGGR